MSIAVSACVAPSARLRALLASFSLVMLGAAATVGLVLPERFGCATFCAAFFLVAAAFSLHACASATKTHRIDVSGTGAVRLTVQQEMGADVPAARGIDVTLLPESLLWPQLMLLHLTDSEGRTTVVTVLRDSLAPLEYRALRVALGSLCGRTGTAATTNEIL